MRPAAVEGIAESSVDRVTARPRAVTRRIEDVEVSETSGRR